MQCTFSLINCDIKNSASPEEAPAEALDVAPPLPGFCRPQPVESEAAVVTFVVPGEGKPAQGLYNVVLNASL